MHIVSVIAVQADFTPTLVPHVVADAHIVHGALPVAEKDVPATHGTTGHVSAAQSVS